MDFTHVKVGDYVWIAGAGRLNSLEQVTGLTAKMILIGNRRYPKSSGIQYGALSNHHIKGVAGEDEVAAWKAQQEAKRREREEMSRQQEVAEQKRQELAELFQPQIWVSRSGSINEAYDIYGLTEEQVRLCADILKATEAASVLP